VEDRTKGTFLVPNQDITDGAETSFQKRKHPMLSSVIMFTGLFCLWIVLSGKLDWFHLSLGLISCLIITIISKDLVFPHSHINGFWYSIVRFLGYIPWLLYKIFLANLNVLFLVFHPKMMERIDPRIFKFQSRLHKDLALVTFANSITLTPGTITVYVNVNGTFTVHALDQKSREALPGDMEKRIARVFEGD